jgi:hypothetical protein
LTWFWERPLRKKINDFMNRLTIVAFLLVEFSSPSFCQSQEKYLIITFEVLWKPSVHKEILHYYWTLPFDSIAKGKVQPYPLFLSEVISIGGCRELAESIFGKPIRESDVEAKSDSLFHLVRENQRLYQRITSITMKPNGKELIEEIVRIYITPIQGDFCDCLSGTKLRHGFLPIRNFRLYGKFWDSYRNEKFPLPDLAGFRYQEIRP